MAVRWLNIRTVVVWGASLGGLDSMVTISKLWFNSIERSIESFVVFAGWLFERRSSGSGNGHLVLGRSLVLATVVWFWRRSSGSGNGPLLPACLPACLPTYLSACLPACLPACLLACLPASLPACLRSCLHACMPARLCLCLVRFGREVRPIEAFD